MLEDKPISAKLSSIARLVARLEVEETLDAAAIRACRAPDEKITPLLQAQRRNERERRTDA